MYGDYGYFEEGHVGRRHDLRLLGRLVVFFKPYLLWLAISVVLMIVMAGLDLALPYLTKTAIDRYITSASYQVDLTGKATRSAATRLVSRYGHYLIPTGHHDRYFIDALGLQAMDPKDLARFKTAGLIGEDRYLFVAFPQTGGTAAVTASPAPFVTGLPSDPANPMLPPPEPVSTSVIEQVLQWSRSLLWQPAPANVQTVIDKYPEMFERVSGRAYFRAKAAAKLSGDDLRLLRGRDLIGIYQMAALFILCSLLNLVFYALDVIVMEYAGQMIMMDLRMALYRHIQVLSMRFFDGNPVGRLVTRVTNDVENMNEMFKSVVTTMFKDSFLIAGIVIVLWQMNRSLALLVLAMIPVVAVATMVFGFQARDAFRLNRTKIAQINSFLQECLNGVAVLKGYRLENGSFEKFRITNYENYLAGMKQVRVFAVFMPLMEVLSAVTVALVVWYGGGKVIQDAISLGTLVAFLSYVTMLFKPVRDMAEKYNIMQNALASSERIFQLLDTQDPDALEQNNETESPVRGDVVFDRVSFAYKPGEAVLKEVSFQVGAGEKVALVGATGSGKTTLISLLEGFYPRYEGRILLDGQDIRGLSPYFLRSQVGLALQDVYLFSDTVRENIAPGRTDLSSEEVADIARSMNADHFIQSLPNGYNTVLSENASTLSSGQRQLLAFCRVLAYNPRVLILDEATSHVDTETEQLIQHALDRLMIGRTCIIVAHRLSTIKKADRIIVMHKGRLLEQGTHAQLMAARGAYFRLYQLQYTD
ncbi:MAG: ABC transporter ATP-binding protein [Deltaproteobacteria bacterium]|nr:ABC transporter ATP-binding protein [Deltaproteobacteria bacterium]MBF0524465.1 ABC transporter ATP-binding protein [Deltaproteobacteria bacterium]